MKVCLKTLIYICLIEITVSLQNDSCQVYGTLERIFVKNKKDTLWYTHVISFNFMDGLKKYPDGLILGPYIYDVHTEGAGGVLKFVTCLRVLLFLNNRSVHFCGWWG